MASYVDTLFQNPWGIALLTMSMPWVWLPIPFKVWNLSFYTLPRIPQYHSKSSILASTPYHVFPIPIRQGEFYYIKTFIGFSHLCQGHDMIFLPVAGIVQSMPLSRWHGLSQSHHPNLQGWDNSCTSGEAASARNYEIPHESRKVLPNSPRMA